MVWSLSLFREEELTDGNKVVEIAVFLDFGGEVSVIDEDCADGNPLRQTQFRHLASF